MIKNILRFFLSLKYFLAIGAVLAVAIYLLINTTKPTQAAPSQTITDQNGDGVIDLIDARILSPPATTSCVVCVDVNGDKQITQMDVDLVKFYAGLGNPVDGSKYSYKSRFDVNNDGRLSIEDANIVQTYIGQSITGSVFGLAKPSELTYGFVANELLVKYKAQAAGSEKNSIVSKYSLGQKQSLTGLNAEEYSVPSGNLEGLQKTIATEPTVERVYKNHIGEVATNDTYWNDQWGHQKIRIEQTWFTETTGSSSNPVRVAIIDTGVDVNHVDLAANISTLRRNAFEYNALSPEFTNVTDTDPPHGTLIAGVIGAVANNNQGIAGLNWNVEIIPVKAGNALRAGDISDPRIVESAAATGFFWAMAQPNVKVINMSFCMGYDNSDDYLTSDLIKQARDDFAITLIAAAGNDGRPDSCYPASHDKVVSVGASTQNDSLAPRSNTGQLDIIAPGVSIKSTTPTSFNATGYESIDGTSISAAYASGVAALCRAVAPLNTQAGNLTRNDLKCNRFDTNGYGRLDAWATIWWRNCYKYDFDNDLHIGLHEAQTISFRLNQPASNPRYDLAPVGGDGQINVGDLWAIAPKIGLDCPPR